MSRARLNSLIRIILGFVVAITIAFVIVAARPGYRKYGSYQGKIGTPQAMIGEWDQVAAQVTVSHPSVVTFPSEWKLHDIACMVITYQRGAAPITLPFDDLLPQSDWDLKPEDALVITALDFVGVTDEGAMLVLDWGQISSLIDHNSPFQIRWLNPYQSRIYKEYVTEGLFCFHFIDGKRTARIPFGFGIELTVSNTHLTWWPTYIFRYNAAEEQNPDAIELQKKPITDYLFDLLAKAPSIVKPLTESQLQQRNEENIPD